jgi:uncharacterized protein (TIGR03437 family)
MNMISRINRLVYLILVAEACYAQNTIHVPADKATIQAAILSASNGDTVLVSPGTYREKIDFSKRAITVKSLSGPDVTIIDGGQNGTVVSFTQGEGSNSILQGFTIQNGSNSGIYVSGSSPTILSNKIIHNTGCEGGGINVNFGSPLIRLNTLTSNGGSTTCGGRGGGGIIIAGDSKAQVLDNTITGNTATGDGGGILNWAGGATLVRHNVITGNIASGSGGAMASVNSANMTIVGNLMAGNKASGPGAIWFSNPPAALINNTIADNQSTNNTLSAVSGVQTSFSPQLRIIGNLIIASAGQVAFVCGTYNASPIAGVFQNNDVYAGGSAPYANCVDQTGSANNISANPKFLNSSAANYRLQATSPAINAGDPTPVELISTDLDGNPQFRSGKVDMGAFEYPGPTTSTLSAINLTFPQQAVGSSSAVQAITLTNTGTVPLQISSIAVTGDFSQTNTCPSGAGLAAGANCLIAVTFTPTGRGPRLGAITIASNATATPAVVNLSGSAVGAVVSLSPTTVTFPNQLANTDSAPLQLTVTNTGDYPLTVTDISTSSEFTQTNTCSVAIAVGSNCAVSIVFHPVASGIRSGTLTIASNQVGGSLTVNLVGNGLAPVPVLSSLSPNNVPTGSGAVTLTVQGSNFIANSVVQWNGSARPTTFVSSTQLTAAIPATDLVSGGSFPLTILNPSPGGGPSNAVAITVANRMPAVSSLSPTSALVGASGFQLTVSGSSFVVGSVVRWNGNDRNTSFVSSTQLRADISAQDISFASTSQVTVFNPAPGGGLSGSLTFTALVPNPLPSLSSISPSSATAGDQGFTLTVFGSGFVSNSVVQWNRLVRSTTYISDSQLQAVITTSDLAAGGAVPVTVNNPSPGGGTSSAVAFSIAGNAFPAVSFLSPSTIVGGSAITLTVNGSGFYASSVVQWNGANRPTSFVSSSQLTAAIPATDTAAPGTAKVTVTSPPPGGGTSNAVNITITANSAPVVSSLVPSSLVAGAAGQALQIRGTGFNSTSVVRWDGQDRASTLVDSNTLSILLTAADLAVPGISDLRVFNPPLGGGTSDPLWFAATIGIAPAGMVYDPTRSLLWISVPSSTPKLGNSVVSVDPATGTLGQPIFVGSDPGKVVISDDGQYLYVALTTAAGVRRVDLKSQQADLQFAVGSDGFFGPMYVEDMAVMPGSPHTVAISRMYKGVSPRHAGVAIYDDGVPRQNITQVHTGSNRIEFSSAPTTIYGFNNETTEFGFRILTVDVNGVKETQVFGSSPIGGFNADMKYEGGRIYATSGAILDPGTGSLIGKFGFGNSSTAFGLAPDSSLGRSFFATGNFGGSAAALQVFDTTMFTPIGVMNFAGLTIGTTGDDILVRFGADGLAVRGTSQLFLIHSTAVRPASLSSSGIVNAASFASRPVAAGGVTTVFGQNLTPLSLGATGTPLPLSLGGVGVFVNGAASPMFYASPGQINFQVPWELAGKPNADLDVAIPGFQESTVKLNLTTYSPGIFTSTGDPGGQAIATVANTTTLVAPSGTAPGSRPAARGEYLTVYCTGLGPVNNQPATGSVSPSNPVASTTAQPTVTIGGQSANVIFSGLAPGLIGVYQVNVQVPASTASGSAIPIVLRIGGVDSNAPTIAVQ